MEVLCPECSSRFPGLDGVMQTCPACMHSFELELETEDRVPDLMKIQLQGPLGEALGLYDIYQLKQQVYEGALSGREFIRYPGGDWKPVYEQGELESLFQLTGVDLVAIRLSAQKVKGWQRDESAVKAESQKKARSGIQAVHGASGKSRDFQPGAAGSSEGSGLPTWLPLVGGVALLGVLLFLAL